MCPSSSGGAVQPFGARSTIIGHLGRSAFPVRRASACAPRIASTQRSSVAAIAWCIESGSEPSTRNGVQPRPRNRLVSSSVEMRASSVGLSILYPFSDSTGSTAPSRIGFRNLFRCHDVASGPVSATPSPTPAATIRFGLSNAAPQACESTYPSSPPSWMEPGVSGVQWLPMPPGNENAWKKRRSPSSSRLRSG